MNKLINELTIGKSKFLISSYGVCISLKIKDIKISSEYLELIFDNGFVIIEDTTTIRKVKKPANTLGVYKFCYSLSDGDKHIGYICESIK